MKIIRPKAAAEKCGFALPTLWRKIQTDPDFPKPIKLSDVLTGFVESEIDAYLEKKVAEFRAQPTKRSTSAGATAASAQKAAADRAAKAVLQ